VLASITYPSNRPRPLAEAAPAIEQVRAAARALGVGVGVGFGVAVGVAVAVGFGDAGGVTVGVALAVGVREALADTAARGCSPVAAPTATAPPDPTTRTATSPPIAHGTGRRFAEARSAATERETGPPADGSGD
jgi:hypothetical protein